MKRTPLERKAPMARAAFKPKEPAERKRRTRKCAVKLCRIPFEPRSMTHRACSPVCAQALVGQEKARADRKARQEGLAKLKRKADYMRETQTALNAWIRLGRDRDKPCISCGRHHEGQYHAGHFLARGSHPHLALVEANLAKQCMPCNVFLSGNQLAFRRGLIERIGLAAVEALEADNTPKHYSIDDLKAIKAHYQAKLRELKGQSNG